MNAEQKQKQALIADCKASISRIEKSLPHWRESTYTRPYLESELARQKIALAALTAQPVAWGIKSQLDWLDRHNYLQADLFSQQRFDEVPLFTRPAPAVSLAELVPDEEALRVEFEGVERKSDGGFNLHRYDTVYADDETQERWDLWLSCRAAIMRNIEEAK